MKVSFLLYRGTCSDSRLKRIFDSFLKIFIRKSLIYVTINLLKSSLLDWWRNITKERSWKMRMWFIWVPTIRNWSFISWRDKVKIDSLERGSKLTMKKSCWLICEYSRMSSPWKGKKKIWSLSLSLWWSDWLSRPANEAWNFTSITLGKCQTNFGVTILSLKNPKKIEILYSNTSPRTSLLFCFKTRTLRRTF